MNPQGQSRVEESVPHPRESKGMTEAEKKALELSGEIEHAHGTQREKLAEKADELGAEQ